MGSLKPYPKKVLVFSHDSSDILVSLGNLLAHCRLDRTFDLTSDPKSSVSPAEVVLISDLSTHDPMEISASMSRAKTIILDLENIEAVRLSGNAKGRLRWLCTKDPRKLVGPLVDYFEGTYFDLSDQTLVDTRAHQTISFPCMPESKATIRQLVATVAIACQLGIPDREIEDWLASEPRANSSQYNYATHLSHTVEIKKEILL